MKKIAPAIIEETKKIAIATFSMVVLMWVVFGIGHAVSPEKIPLDYTVFLGGFCGGVVAVLNFFLMGLAVQKVTDTQDDDLAKARMRASYSQRFLMQIVWVVLAIVLPCFHFVAGIAPLLFPSFSIRFRAFLPSRK